MSNTNDQSSQSNFDPAKLAQAAGGVLGGHAQYAGGAAQETLAGLVGQEGAEKAGKDFKEQGAEWIKTAAAEAQKLQQEGKGGDQDGLLSKAGELAEKGE